MTGFETPIIAREALKPASGIINALLAPKVDRIGAWARERDLASRSRDEVLIQPLTRYARRLLRRVSGITTLVFPEQVLPLPDIYEPLSLKPLFANTFRPDFARRSRLPLTENEASDLSLTTPGRRSLIIDRAGMGKSTFVRHLALRQVIDSDRIPLLLELRRIPRGVSLKEALARELDEVERPFDRDVFNVLLGSARFVLVLDGLDEVPSADLPDMIAQIETLSSLMDCAMIVTSRPEVPLPGISGAAPLTLETLTDEQAASMVRRYDRIAGIDVGERLIARFPTVPAQFLQTPLLLALLYRTFGYSGQVSERISSFYEDLYSALFKGHDLAKSGFSRDKLSRLEHDAFRRLLRGFSFLAVVYQQTTLPSRTAALEVIEEAQGLTGERPASSSDFMADLLLAVPLLLREGNAYAFVHRTIGEYFAAEFVVFAERASEILEDLCRPEHEKRFFETVAFVKELNPSLFRKVVAGPIARDFLRHRPDLGDSALRTLDFIAPGILVSLSTGAPKLDPHLLHSRFHFEFDQDVNIGAKSARLIFEIPAIRSMAALVTDLFCRIGETHSERKVAAFSELPVDQTFALTDPLLREGERAEPFAGMCKLLLEVVFKDRAEAEEAALGGFEEGRVRAMLEQLETEARKGDSVRKLLAKSSSQPPARGEA